MGTFYARANCEFEIGIGRWSTYIQFLSFTSTLYLISLDVCNKSVLLPIDCAQVCTCAGRSLQPIILHQGRRTCRPTQSYATTRQCMWCVHWH